MNISILGNGAWGKAMYSVVVNNSDSVSLLGKGDTSSDNDIAILAVPTQSIREALSQVTFKDKKIIINTAKGIEKSTHLFPHEIVSEGFGKDVEYYSLIGPSFANEVVQQMPTIVNLGYKEPYESVDMVHTVLQTNYFRVKPVKGVRLIEMSGALKNIYAIAGGIADGLGYGTNTRVKLLVLAIEEMNSLCDALDLPRTSDAIAGTIGDLVLTCNSVESRNFKFGKLLTKLSVADSLTTVASTVEGYNTLASLNYFEASAGIQLPLARFLFETISRDNPETLRKELNRFIVST